MNEKQADDKTQSDTASDAMNVMPTLGDALSSLLLFLLAIALILLWKKTDAAPLLFFVGWFLRSSLIGIYK